jgi:hypothetical protein
MDPVDWVDEDLHPLRGSAGGQLIDGVPKLLKIFAKGTSMPFYSL